MGIQFVEAMIGPYVDTVPSVVSAVIGIIAVCQRMVIIEIPEKFGAFRFGIGVSMPFDASAILEVTGQCLVLIDVIAKASFPALGIEAVILFAEVSFGNIHGCLGPADFPGNDIDNPAFGAAAIHGGCAAAEYFDTLNVVGVAQEGGIDITVLPRSFQVRDFHAVHKDYDILGAVNADAADIAVQCISAIVEELYAGNGSKRFFDISYVKVLYFLP